MLQFSAWRLVVSYLARMVNVRKHAAAHSRGHQSHEPFNAQELNTDYVRQMEYSAQSPDYVHPTDVSDA